MLFRSVTFGVGDSPIDIPMLKVVDVPLLVRNTSGGKNARLVVWRNVLRLVTQKARNEPEFNVLAEQLSTLNCQTRTFPEAGPEN